VPDPNFPFLGVFSRVTDSWRRRSGTNGARHSREGYTLSTVNVRDLADALGFVGLWRFLPQASAHDWTELAHPSAKRFCDALRRLVRNPRG
jgi:hypothetical protein